MEKPLFVASPEDERVAREIRVTHIFSIRLYVVGRSVPLDPRSPEIGRSVFVLISNAFLESGECRAWLHELLAADKLLHVIFMEDIDRASIPELADDMKDAFLLYHKDGTPASYQNYRRGEYGRLKKAMELAATVRMFVVYGGATPQGSPGPNRPELSFWYVPQGRGRHIPVIVERTRRRLVARKSDPAGASPPDPSGARAPVSLKLVPPSSPSLPAAASPWMDAAGSMAKSFLIAAPEDEWLARRLRSSSLCRVRLCIVESSMDTDAADPAAEASIFILLSNAFVRQPACRSVLDKVAKLDSRVILAEEIDEASVPALATALRDAYRLYHEDGQPASPVNCRVSEYRRLLEVMANEAEPPGRRAGLEAPPPSRTKVVVVEHKRRWRFEEKPPA
jgi:hypothetical protein